MSKAGKKKTDKTPKDMYKIHILKQTGPSIDQFVQRTLFNLAQFMLEQRIDNSYVHNKSCNFAGTIVTNFNTGFDGKTSGVIFKAKIKYNVDGTEDVGELTKMVFLANYMPDWRERCIDTINIEYIEEEEVPTEVKLPSVKPLASIADFYNSFGKILDPCWRN
jgi:hypothetical protein